MISPGSLGDYMLPLHIDSVRVDSSDRYPSGYAWGSLAIQAALAAGTLNEDNLAHFALGCPIARNPDRMIAEPAWDLGVLDRVSGVNSDELVDLDPEDAQYDRPDRLVDLGNDVHVFLEYISMALSATKVRNDLLVKLMAGVARRSWTRKDAQDAADKALGFYGFLLRQIIAYPGSARGGGEIGDQYKQRLDLSMIVPLVEGRNTRNPTYAFLWRPGLELKWNPDPTMWDDPDNRVFPHIAPVLQLFSMMKALGLNMPAPLGIDLLRKYVHDSRLEPQEMLEYVATLRHYAYPRFLRYLATLEHKAKNGLSNWAYPAQVLIWMGAEAMWAGVTPEQIKWDWTKMLLNVADHFTETVGVPWKRSIGNYGRKDALSELDHGLHNQHPGPDQHSVPTQVLDQGSNSPRPLTNDDLVLFRAWNPTRLDMIATTLREADITELGKWFTLVAAGAAWGSSDAVSVIKAGAGYGWCRDEEGNFAPELFWAALFELAKVSNDFNAALEDLLRTELNLGIDDKHTQKRMEEVSQLRISPEKTGINGANIAAVRRVISDQFAELPEQARTRVVEAFRHLDPEVPRELGLIA